MTGDCHVQFSESARVKFSCATRLFKKLLNPNLTYGKSILADQNNVKRRNNKNALESLPLLLFRRCLPRQCYSTFCKRGYGAPISKPICFSTGSRAVFSNGERTMGRF